MNGEKKTLRKGRDEGTGRERKTAIGTGDRGEGKKTNVEIRDQKKKKERWRAEVYKGGEKG